MPDEELIDELVDEVTRRIEATEGRERIRNPYTILAKQWY